MGLKTNEIYLGDCLELMKDIDDKSVDMVLCDLPYGTTACQWDSIIPFEPLWEQYERIIKDNGTIALTASQPFTSALIMSNPKMFKYEWIWQKDQGTNFMLAKKQPLKIHENICIFYKSQPTYIPDMEYVGIKDTRKTFSEYTKDDDIFGGGVIRKRKKDNGYRYPTTIRKFNKERGLHPTQKPVALMEYLIKTYSNEGETVLDNCMGSGTTAIASINTGRFFIGIEKDEGYCNVAKKRIADHET